MEREGALKSLAHAQSSESRKKVGHGPNFFATAIGEDVKTKFDAAAVFGPKGRGTRSNMDLNLVLVILIVLLTIRSK
jgi:hypothetical protein